MLHKASALRGFHIHATDGEIGHVDDFLLDEQGCGVRYLEVDTSNWAGGKSVLIAASAVQRIDSEHRQIHVALSRAAVSAAPLAESADVDPNETRPVVWIM